MESTLHISSDFEFTRDFEIRDSALQNLQRRMDESSIDLRDALSEYVPIADEYQSNVIEAPEDTIRVLAPAGSGKTQTMVNRVIASDRRGIKPSKILMLTFDNAAASSITDKMADQLEKLELDLNDGPEIRTLNAFGYYLLRTIFKNEYKPVIQDYKSRRIIRGLLDDLEKKSKERYEALPSNLDVTFYLDFVSFLKNKIVDPRKANPQMIANIMMDEAEAEPFFKDPGNRQLVTYVIEAVIWLFETYENALNRESYLDFDDQKLRAFVELRNNQSVLASIQGNYSEFIVDEFQDINLLDFEFIKLISQLATLIVTGDDDQAIYGFRGCSPEFIINLQSYLGREVTSYELRVNYRCPPNIVTHATRLIEHNAWRVKKSPIAHRETHAEIKVIDALSAGLEAKLIRKFIQRIIRSNENVHHRDVAILYRTNAQNLPLQIEMILAGIPYFVREKDNVLQNQTLRRLLAILRVKIAIQNHSLPRPEDSGLIPSAYFRYVSKENENRLISLANQLPDISRLLVSEEVFSILPKARSSNILQAMNSTLKAKSLMDTLDVLAKDFKGLRGMIGSLEDVAADRVPLGEIYELAANFKGRTENFVHVMDDALQKARKMNAGYDKANGVGLLTYFKAKGLQWHTVILCGCNEGLIPHSRSPLEEERRLFYVALTRPTSNLLISYLKNSCNNKVKPSRFLKEAGLLR